MAFDTFLCLFDGELLDKLELMDNILAMKWKLKREKKND